MIMASSSNSYSLLRFSPSSPSIPISFSKFPIQISSVIHSRRRHQHPVAVLKEKSGAVLGFSGLVEKKGLGCSIRLLQRNSWFGSIPRRCNKGWGSEGEGDFALEIQILEFMDCSDNPRKFPTKKDLINAGRGDLVQAIEKYRDWLSKGWDLDEEEEEEEKEIVQENEIVELMNSRVEEDLGIIASQDSSTPSPSGREMEKEEEESVEKEDDAGINGFKEKKTDVDDLSRKNDHEDSLLFRSRLQHLELELASTLQSLKSVSEIDTSSLKGSDSPLDEFLELSNAWEFQQTEVMNAKNKLRSICAELAILEGKIALAAIESQKNLEMKQKRINDAQLALSTLRTACIVWPNNKDLAVLVCGSFDGWIYQALQRMMEKYNSGFVILSLELYLGRCEGTNNNNSSRSHSSDKERSNSPDREASADYDGKNTWKKSLHVMFEKLWDSILESQSSWDTCMEPLGNLWWSYAESNRLEYEHQMESIFIDFDFDQFTPLIFMNQAERNYNDGAYEFFKGLFEAFSGPLKVLKVVFLVLLSVPIWVGRRFCFTIYAALRAGLGDKSLGGWWSIIKNVFLKWFMKTKFGKLFFPKPPKQPRPKKPKPPEEVIIDVEGHVVEEEVIIDIEGHVVEEEGRQQPSR